MTDEVKFRPNVAAILRRPDGRILIGERHDFPGSWQFPQGGIHGTETPEEALRRELAEELTGVSVPYVRRKLSEDRWRMDDLDALPEIFGREPSDYVQGYRQMAHLDEIELADDQREKETRDDE